MLPNSGLLVTEKAPRCVDRVMEPPLNKIVLLVRNHLSPDSAIIFEKVPSEVVFGRRHVLRIFFFCIGRYKVSVKMDSFSWLKKSLCLFFSHCFCFDMLLCHSGCQLLKNYDLPNRNFEVWLKLSQVLWRVLLNSCWKVFTIEKMVSPAAETWNQNKALCEL